VANISLLFLEYHNYGYYIHGKAPWGESDLPLSWLKKELDSEQSGNQKTRQFSERTQNSGINLAQQPNVITTYEIYISKDFRDEFDEFLLLQHPKDVNPNENPQEEDAPLQKKKVDQGPMSPEEVQISIEEDKRLKLNKRLTDAFSKAQTADVRPIVEREWYERLFKSVPQSFDPVSSKDKLMLVQDASENFPTFEGMLYCELDYQIVLLNILWFYFFDHWTGNSMLAITLTFCIERILRWVRTTWGEKNLSKKTFISDAFFV
jgi:hypothetical protein